MITANPFKTDKPGASGRSYPTEDRSKPSPEWNHYRIECNNGSISLAVSGGRIEQVLVVVNPDKLAGLVVPLEQGF